MNWLYLFELMFYRVKGGNERQTCEMWLLAEKKFGQKMSMLQ